MQHPIILFDGVCNLCNGFVQFILKHEQQQEIHFTTLKSKQGIALLQQYNLPIEQTPSSIVLIEKNQCYTQSTAILRISQYLVKPWKYGRYLMIIPKPLRDILYQLIARNRYYFFGQATTCWLPTAALQQRFLEH